MGYLSAIVDVAVAAAVLPWEADCGWFVELGDVDEDKDEYEADRSKKPYWSCHSHY